MQRRTIDLPDDLDVRLRHEADRRGTTVPELMRFAIEAYLNRPGRRRRFIGTGAGASGHEDVSARIDAILRNEVG